VKRATLVLLGTGTVMPDAERASAGLALHVGGRWLPIDLGRGVLQRLSEHGVDALALTNLLLTHWHPDHACDLVPLLFARNYAVRSLPARPLCIIAPPGFGEFLERLYDAWRWLRPRAGELEIRDGEDPELEFEGVAIRGALLAHGGMPNLGFRLEGPQRHIVYTGDTSACEALLTLTRGAHILVSECSLAAGTERADHMDPVALGQLAAESAVGELVVTHVGAELARAEILDGIRIHFGGPVSFARDRMALRL